MVEIAALSLSVAVVAAYNYWRYRAIHPKSDVPDGARGL